MATAESTLTLGEVFLETADGTKISLGQLKAPFNITIEPPKSPTENKTPAEIRIGSPVRIEAGDDIDERAAAMKRHPAGSAL